MLSILVSMMSGVVFVAADEAAATSTLTEILSYDFDSDASEFETQMGYYATISGKTNETGTPQSDSNTYGIGSYRRITTSAFLPLVVDNSTGTPVLSGLERLSVPNKYLEIEYDYFPIDYSTTKSTYGALGVGAVTYDSSSSLANVGYFGSLYHRYTFESNNVIFGFENGETTKFEGVTPVLDKWHRIKLVTQLTTDTLKDGSNTKYKTPNTKCIKTYVDGVLVNEKYYKGTTTNLTDEYVRALRFHALYGRAGIDNLTVRTYQSGDAPVDKGALVAAIRNFLSTYTNYRDYADAATLINAAKATYENAAATDTDVTTALANVESAINIVDPKPQTYFEYDFETDANLTAFYNAAGISSAKSRVTVKEDNSRYGIGKYVTYNSGNVYVALDPAISRAASKNMYLELEMDIKPEEPSASDFAATTTNRAAVYLTTTQSSDYVGAGIECNYDNPTNAQNNECLTIPYKESKKLKSFKYDEWYRCKVVCLLNDNGSTDNKEGLVKYFIDGNLVGTSNYNSSSFTDAAYVRFYGGYAKISVDNLSVKTYTADNPAPDKASLVSKIREFIKNYPEYTDNADALALFNQAAAIYNSDETEAMDISTALGYLAQAERKLFNAEPLIKESFEGTPMYFFDTVAGTSYDSSAAALPTGASYADDDTYLVTTALKLPAATAVKNFTSVALGASAATKYVTAECDVNTSGSVTVKLSDSVSYTLADGESEWKRIRFDIDTMAKTYDVYVNGEKKVTAASITEDALSALTVAAESELTIDNVNVYGFENTADVVSDKGGLVTGLRASKALLDAGTMTDDETALMTTIFDKYAVVNERPSAAKADIDDAATWVKFYNENLSAQLEGAKSIVIPGTGKSLTDVIVNLNLHHGSQAGNAEWRDIFFGGEGSNDFSDVRFYGSDGQGLGSHIESTGNYDFIKDSNLVAGAGMFYLSDGRILGKKGGKVQVSSDGGKTWSILGEGYTTSNIVFVDRDDNIYHFRENDPVYGPCPLFKIYASDNYATEKMMIDSSDLYDLYNNYNADNVIEDYDVTSASYSEGYDMQDDDGHIYIGRYQTEWTGAALFVSDENGENFRIADFRPDKQHVHSIAINHNVYPNEVYVCYDDSYSQPLCYVSTDHFGYDGLKDSEIHQLPTVARSTGGREGFKSIQDGDLYSEILMPKNQATEDIMKLAKKHYTQVPIPFGNSDYLRYFEVIEDRESSPEKFVYNEEKGKWYTVKNKEYYNAVGEFTHYYSDNVYAMGCGEANILGGPGAYKTTDIMDPLKYYPVIKTTEGARRIMSPAEGVIIYSALSGGYSQQAQVYVSYDDGETWETAYTSGYEYSTDAGNGPGRYVAGPWDNVDGTTEVLMNGYGVDAAVRGTFGGDNYFALSSVSVPVLPEDGIKIFVKQDGEAKETVTTYYYGMIDETTPAIRSSKTSEGNGDALKFPLSGNGKSMVYLFDVDTVADTLVEANLTVSASHGNEDVAKAVFNTLDGTVELNGIKSQTASAAVAQGSFSGKLITYEDGTCKLYVNDELVCTASLTYDYINLALLSFNTKDVAGGSVPELASPVEVYYSNVSYGEYNPAAGQFILEAVTYTKDGEAAAELADGVTIADVTISQVDMDIAGGVLVVCLKNDDGDKLIKCKTVPVTGSGTYDVGLTADSEGLNLKFYLLKDLQTVTPIKLINCLEVAAQ